MESFPSDTSPTQLHSAFQAIREHNAFKDLKLKVAVYSVKNSSKKPFMNYNYEEFTSSVEQYVGGAFAFSQEALKLLFEHHGEAPLSETGTKKGTLIFTGTMGALRCNAEFAAYGVGRGSVRQLAQTLAREMSAKGVHVGGCSPSSFSLLRHYSLLRKLSSPLTTLLPPQTYF